MKLLIVLEGCAISSWCTLFFWLFRVSTLGNCYKEALDAYVDYYNEKRPCYAIGYDTPNNYRKRFYKGELPRMDTFGKREANATPKFVTERKKMAGNEKNKE